MDEYMGRNAIPLKPPDPGVDATHCDDEQLQISINALVPSSRSDSAAIDASNPSTRITPTAAPLNAALPLAINSSQGAEPSNKPVSLEAVGPSIFTKQNISHTTKSSVLKKSNAHITRDKVILVPAMKNNRKFPNSSTKNGVVIRIMPNNVSGLLEASLTENRLVFFHINQTVNHSDQEVGITVGLNVTFDLDSNEESKQKPKAQAVYVGSNNLSNNEIKDNQTIFSKNGWQKGTICSNINEKYFYVKPDKGYEHGNSKDVYVYADKISSYVLKIKEGDKMEYILGERDKERPMARKIRILLYLPRNSSELINYFACLLENLSGSMMHDALEDVLNNLTQWKLFSSLIFKNSAAFDNYFYPYIHCLTVVIRKAKRFQKELLIDATKCVLSGVLFSPVNEDQKKLWMSFFKDLNRPDFKTLDGASKIEIISDFLISQVQEAPNIKNYLQPFLKCISESNPSSEIQKLLFNIWLMSIENDTKLENGLDAKWNKMPMCITNEELSGSLVTEDKHLSQVKYGPFESEEDYMDTYFRLLRAETFESIQKGIQALKCNKLDKRDMNVYSKIFVVGTYLTHSSFSIAVNFIPDKPVRDWSKSPQLMFGNLVCLSPKQNFASPIWATVAERDPELLKQKKIILLDLCDFNSLPKSKAILSLLQYGGQTVMVESPVYFNSLKPVLQAFQQFEMEEFDLAEEIIFTNLSLNSTPNYLMIKQDNNQTSLQKIQTSLNYFTIYHQLEKSQKIALDHALNNRLAIIQGPPGCGKTYLGVKIVEVLLNSTDFTDESESLVPLPILVLTYKNHALDEFLVKMIDLYGANAVVRIGGRSQDSRLEECNLFKISRMPGHLFFDIRELQEEIALISDDINAIMNELQAHSSLTMLTFFECLSDIQIKEFMLKNLSKPDKKKFCDIIKDIPSLKDFFLSNHENKLNSNGQFLFDKWKNLVQNWLPSEEKVRDLKKLQTKYLNFTSAEVEKNENKESDHNKEDNIDELDEDYINELHTSRQLINGETLSKESSIKINLIRDPNEKLGFKLSDFPHDLKPDYNMLAVDNIGCLDEIQKIQFIFTLLFESCEMVQKKLDVRMCELEQKIQKKRSAETSYKSSVCKNKKIVGMTITGASIHHELIRKIAPKIVIVEEAAEILEPSLLAALNSETEHLILIGDQKQLRPQVESFKLRKDYHFDVSMMERLIASDIQYQTLERQNRMRPEFSSMLKDIYPFLEDNLEIVSNHKPVACVTNSYFFWSHEFPETGRSKSNDDSSLSRSMTNPKEADMAATLAMFLISCGSKPESITILAAYLGQVKLLREKLKNIKAAQKEIFENSSLPKVSTIDMYQGDENDYVIVSLVRSNKFGKNDKGAIGFLKEQNRRCVAQSRAKCSLFFVGNKDTFSCDKGWYHIIKQMENNNCVSSSLPIQCPKHLKQSQSLVQTAEELLKFISKPSLLCKYSCDQLMKCQKHNCKKSCNPPHLHETCKQEVTDIFGKCGHYKVRYCYEDINSLQCEIKVNYTFPNCGHSCSKKCWVNENTLKCNNTCSKLMNCGLHACTAKCGHPHSHFRCEEVIKFTFINCKHDSKKKCFEPESDLKCYMIVNTLLNCGHTMESECFKKKEDINCTHPCSHTATRNCKHKCVKKCGQTHNHESCDEIIEYKFPECQHPSPRKKRCSEPISWKCNKIIFKKCEDCHKDSSKKICHEPDFKFRCEMPCTKKRKCTHLCTLKCYEMCEKVECSFCGEQKMKVFKEHAKMRIEQIESEKTKSITLIENISKKDENAAEYQRIEDLVLKFIQPEHSWYPTITKIEKVRNPKLELQFEKAKLDCYGDHIAEKFHGTSDEGVKGITMEGFRLPINDGMYGKGIYFATDSSKSAQVLYTKGSNKLLLCKVILGRSYKILRAEKFNFEKLKRLKMDSVFAPRDSRNTGGVRFDEFVIFNPAQAYPEYIIHYARISVPGFLDIPNMDFVKYPFSKINILTKRTKNPSDPLELHFARAEAHYLRMIMKENVYPSRNKTEIVSIDVVFNQKLETKFNEKKKKFAKIGCGEEILAFHGTSSSNIDSILKYNLDPGRPAIHGRAFGNGCYFSEFPSKSQSYGDGLILFRVLPGRIKDHHIAVQPDQDNYMREMIIQDADQFLPFYVYHF